MKHHFTLIALLILTACETDVYDKGEGEYSMLQAELADVHVGGDLKADRFTTDSGEELAVANPFAAEWMSTPDTSYRAVTYFSKTDKGAMVKGANRVGVLVPKKMSDMKTDPVRLESVWLAKSRRYLNAGVYLMIGSTDDGEAIQKIGCHADTLMLNADGTRTQRLTLFHDQAGVPQYYSQRLYVSIPLGQLYTADGQGVQYSIDSVRLDINTYQGMVSKTFSTTAKP